MQNAKIPVETESIGESHVMFQQEDGMPLMWATQVPMEQLKEMLVVRTDGVRAVQGVQAIAELQAGRLQPGLSMEGGCNKSWNVLCDFEPVEKPRYETRCGSAFHPCFLPTVHSTSASRTQ